MAERSIRFGVTDRAGHRAATWRCWTNGAGGKSDVYLACRELQGKLKLSLHESGRWHVGFDRASFTTMFDEGAQPRTRFLGTWDRAAPICDGLILACRVVVPSHAATVPIETLSKKIFWIDSAPPAKSVQVAIFLCDYEFEEGNWPGRTSMNSGLVGSFRLEGGGHIVAVHHTIPSLNLNFPTTHSPNLFRGITADDLLSEGMRAIVWGDANDGSVQFYDTPIRFTKTKPP
jgi:hypothetical protein